MPMNITGLGKREAEFLSKLAQRGNTLFTTRQAQEFWRNPALTGQALNRLQRKGWIQRLERGLYMVVPLAAGPERDWAEDSFVIATHLARPAAIAYWSAMHHWNMTEHIPQVVFVQSTRRKHKTQTLIGGVTFQFVVVTEKKFFGVITQYRNDQPISITDREKTLIDACDRPDLSGGIALVSQALRTCLDQIEWDRIDDYLARFGSSAVYERLGYLIDRGELAIPERGKRLERWHAQLKTGISPLEPGASIAGHINSRWQLRVNVRGFRP
jgi:predicted transcriptional regulator of viral defense system